MPIVVLLALTAMVATNPVTSGQPTHAPAVVRAKAPPPPKVTGDAAIIPLDLSADIPAFTATVGGRPVKLAFDTGAPGPLRLNEAVARALGLAKVGEARASDPSGRNPVTLPIYSLASASIGGLQISDWQAAGAPRRPGKLETFEGIVGLSAFHGFVVTLDYASSKLEIRRGSLPPADGKTIFDYRDDPIPRLPLTVEGKTVTAHLDTGNSAGAVIVPENFARSLVNHAQAKVIGKARTVSSETVISKFEVTSAPRVGSVPLSTREVIFPAVASLANIGSKALKGMVVRVDPANGRVLLEPAAPAT